MREYEAMIVIQPELDGEGVDGIVESVDHYLAQNGGEMHSTGQLVDRKGNVAAITEDRGWKTRKLAYEINGHREGYYAVLRFNAQPDTIAELEHELRLNEDVLRYLVLRAEEALDEEMTA